MRYPTVCNWVSYRKAEDGIYIVYNDATKDTYRMSSKEFTFFSQLDGKTDPMKIMPEYPREHKQQMLECFERDLLIRRSRVLKRSPGNVRVTLLLTKHYGVYYSEIMGSPV